MKRNKLYLILIILLVIIGYLLINYPTTVGLADNCDFYRVIQPEGLSSNETNKFFYTQQDFEYVKEFDNLLEHIRFIINPEIKNISGYKSTHSVVIKCAQFINGFIKYYKYKKVLDFDIRVLSILYLVIYSLAIVLLIKSIPMKNKIIKAILYLLTIFIYFDKGYLIYFNSFYGEPLILVSLLLYISSLLLIINNRKDKITLYIINFISGCVFIGAKVANIPLGIVMIIFSAFLFHYKKDNKIRLVIIIGSMCMLITSIYYYVSVPKWMCDVNRYHSLFYGVLKESKEPEKDLEYLDIHEKYLCLQGTNGYMNHKGFDIKSEKFREEVYEKATPLKITFYYLSHLDRLLEKMKISAASSSIIRPSYLGNYVKSDYNEALKFDERFTLWERIRKLTYSFSFGMIIIIFLFFIITSLVSLVKCRAIIEKDRYRLLLVFRIMILIFAGSQFVLPVIGNGEADLIKHMFLFNVLLDMMIILILMDLFRLIEIGQFKIAIRIFSILVCVMVIIILINGSYNNKTIVFGKYDNKDIVWEILDESDESYFVATKDIIDCRYFNESNSNLWIESDIRKWLNEETDEGFLLEFSKEEKEKIREVPMKTIMSPDKKTLIQIGEQPHYWYCIPGYVIQNSEIAFGNVNREKVFMLSVKDYDNYVKNKRKSSRYWLRTPYTKSRFVRVVGLDGFVYHKEAVMSDIGVVPCMYIQK